MIVTEINKILECMQRDGLVASIMYQSPAKSNVVVGSKQQPTAVFFCISKTEIDITMGTQSESGICSVYFLDRSNLDFDGLQNEQTIDRMKNIAINFVGRVMSSKDIKFNNTNVKLNSKYNVFDAKLTGVAVEFETMYIQKKCLERDFTNILIDKIENISGNDYDISILYNNYRKIDGLKMAITANGEEVDIIATSTQVMQLNDGDIVHFTITLSNPLAVGDTVYIDSDLTDVYGYVHNVVKSKIFE